MEQKLVRFSISLGERLMSDFDALLREKGYGNRSEALRDLIRDYLVENQWVENRPTVGTITLVYDHHKRELADTLVDFQHRYFDRIISSVHVHLDHHHCLEVLIVRGMAEEIRAIADLLIGTKGVKHGKLIMTTTGEGL